MFWVIIVVVIFIAIFIAKRFHDKKEKERIFSSYQLRNRTMNPSEQALFVNLQKTLGEHFIVLSKVRIEDFVEVKKEIEKNIKWGLRSSIKSRHVDFLICDRATTKPLLAIELDGGSHNGAKKIIRDQFVDELYDAIGLPIEHVPVGGDFLESLQKIKSVLAAN